MILTDTHYDIYLTETHEKQFIKASDYDINFTSSYQYNFRYYDVGTGEEVNFAQNRSLTFDTSEAVSEFNDFIFDKTANYDERCFVVQLDFQDDLKVFSDFQFTITDQDNGEVQDYYLNATTEPQTLTCNESSIDSDSGEETYRIDIVKDALSYTFRYFDTRLNDFVTFANEEFRFQNSVKSEFTGIETSYDFMAETSDQYLLPMRFIFDNKAHSYSGFRVVFEKDNVVAGDLAFEGETLTDNWLYGSYRAQEYGVDEITNMEGIKIIVYAEQNTIDYPALDSEIKVYEKEATFTSGQVTDFYNATIANEYINMSSELGLYVVYQGIADNISAKLLLESYTGVTYTYNLMFDSLNYARVLLSEEDNGLTPSEDDFNDQFINHTMKVSISYSIFTLDPTSTTGSDGSWSTYKTKVLYDSYQFSLSV